MEVFPNNYYSPRLLKFSIGLRTPVYQVLNDKVDPLSKRNETMDGRYVKDYKVSMGRLHQALMWAATELERQRLLFWPLHKANVDFCERFDLYGKSFSTSAFERFYEDYGSVQSGI